MQMRFHKKKPKRKYFFFVFVVVVAFGFAFAVFLVAYTFIHILNTQLALFISCLSFRVDHQPKFVVVGVGYELRYEAEFWSRVSRLFG